jgi:hypothetical protein
MMSLRTFLMSENVARILMNGCWVAASPQRGSVDYQKEVNQKNDQLHPDL